MLKDRPDLTHDRPVLHIRYPLQLWHAEKARSCYICKMKPFQYMYRGQVLNAAVDYFTEEGYDRYRVILDNESFIVAPSGFTGPNGKTIWVQPVKAGEKDQPHDLVQALGEGIRGTENTKPW